MGRDGKMGVLDGAPLEQVYLIADMHIEAPAQSVWAMVGAFADPALGKGFVSHVTLEGEGVGAVRTLHMTDNITGGVVSERQTGRDDRGMYYAYELDDPGDMPFTDYYGSAHVAPIDETSCRVIWLNRYRTSALLVREMKAQSRLLLELIEENLKAALETPAADDKIEENN